jgi:flagellar assembly factor FliW
VSQIEELEKMDQSTECNTNRKNKLIDFYYGINNLLKFLKFEFDKSKNISGQFSTHNNKDSPYSNIMVSPSIFKKAKSGIAQVRVNFYMK